MTFYKLLNYIRTLREASHSRPEWLVDARRRLAIFMATHPLSDDRIRGTLIAAPGAQRLAAAIAMAVVVFMVISGTGLGVAAQTQLPGGVLYPVKLFIEQIQTALASSAPDRVKLSLSHATRRLAEAARVAEYQPSADQLQAALQNYETKLSNVSSQLADLQKSGDAKATQEVAAALASASSEHQQTLRRIEGTVAKTTPATAVAVAAAEKATAASSEAAGKTLIQLDLAAAVGHEPAPAAPDAVDPAAPPTKPTADIKVLTPKVPDVKQEVKALQAETSFDAARRRAADKYARAEEQLNDLKAAFAAAESAIDPAAAGKIKNKIGDAELLLRQAKLALLDNVILTSFERSVGVIIMVIDADTALRLAP